MNQLEEGGLHAFWKGVVQVSRTLNCSLPSSKDIIGSTNYIIVFNKTILRKEHNYLLPVVDETVGCWVQKLGFPSVVPSSDIVHYFADSSCLTSGKLEFTASPLLNEIDGVCLVESADIIAVWQEVFNSHLIWFHISDLEKKRSIKNENRCFNDTYIDDPDLPGISFISQGDLLPCLSQLSALKERNS